MPDFIDKKLLAWRTAWAKDLTSPWARLGAYCDMLFIDHGLVRVFYSNRAQLTQKVERASHPTPGQIKAAAKRGIKTIVNLRGDHPLGASALSAYACAQHGIDLRYLKMRSRGMPTKEQIAELKRLFETCAYPVLFHCKSGADRAGITAALYLLILEQASPEQALEQLSWKFGHFRQAKTGMLDFFVETYRDFNAQTPMPFLDWVDQVYDEQTVRDAYFASKAQASWATFLVDRVLRRE